MILKGVTAEDNSVAIGRDNNGTVINAPGATFQLQLPIASERSLSTYLGTIINVIADQQLSEYGHSYQRNVTAEVKDKLDFNYITLSDHLIRTYTRYFHILDMAYKGVEQSNNDVRVLVRFSAGSIYSRALTSACDKAGVLASQRIEYSRNHAHSLIEAVKKQMIEDVKKSQAAEIDPTWVDLAVSLLIADAVVECDVLEKNPNVTTS
jgi:hypothetical protein